MLVKELVKDILLNSRDIECNAVTPELLIDDVIIKNKYSHINTFMKIMKSYKIIYMLYMLCNQKIFLTHNYSE